MVSSGVKMGVAIPVALVASWYSLRWESRRYTTTVTDQASWVPQGHHHYKLLKSEKVSSDSKVLRFALPESMPTLGMPLPSCLKIKNTFSNPVKSEEYPDETFTIDKSYSVISTPDTKGYFELLVKGYPPRQGGGLGSFITGLSAGDIVNAKIKAKRVIHGDIYRPNRWSHIGFVAAGTGIAPFIQFIRTIVADPNDKTSLSLAFANRKEEDILMREELDTFTNDGHLKRTRYILSKPSIGWTGGKGRITKDDLEIVLPPPSDDVLIMICGTDGFLETVSGMTYREAPKGPKLQGSVTGLLKELGYAPNQVYKF